MSLNGLYVTTEKGELRWRPYEELRPDIHVGSFSEIARYVEWLQNVQVNLGVTLASRQIMELPKIKGAALIIDKSMASRKYFEQLPEIKNYNGTIICCDRAVYTVIEHRRPDYVCNLDSSPLCMSFFDRPDVKAASADITGVFSVTTNPLTIRLWHGPKTFFTPYLLGMQLTKSIVDATNAPYMQTGGNVATFAYLLAYNLGANPIGLFGITNGYETKAESEYAQALKFHSQKEGPYGPYWQDPVYEMYNNEILAYISYLRRTEKIKTVNTMKAGLLYSKDVEDKSLAEFIKENQE